MEFVFVSKNIELTDAIKDYVQKKINRLEKVYDCVQAEVTLSIEKYRHTVVVKLLLKNDTLNATEMSHDLYVSIDRIYDNLERQIKKLKEKKYSKRVPNEKKISSEISEYDYNIIKEKFDPKPISIDDALKLIAGNENNIIVFNNADTEKINVLYKNNDGQHILIET